LKELLEDLKGIIRRRKSTESQYNGQKEKGQTSKQCLAKHYTEN
jgi:hypothetical protein